MIIGIVSDTHGQAERLRNALTLMAQRRVEAIVHCGDIGSAQCVEVLGYNDTPVFAVAGNVDRELFDLSGVAADAGIRLAREMIEVPLPDGRLLAVTHGDNAQLLKSLIEGGHYAYVCHGHTHQRRDVRIGQTRVINPGALHRTSQPTVAVLTTSHDTLEFIPVPIAQTP